MYKSIIERKATSAQNNAQALTAGEPKQAELSLEEQAKIGEIGTAGDNPFLIATAEQLKESARLSEEMMASFKTARCSASLAAMLARKKKK